MGEAVKAVHIPARGQDHLGRVNLSSFVVQESLAWDLPVSVKQIKNVSHCLTGFAHFYKIPEKQTKTLFFMFSYEIVYGPCCCRLQMFVLQYSVEITINEMRRILTQVVVFVLWSMKKGLPLGALRTSQPAGRKPDSDWSSGLC